MSNYKHSGWCDRVSTYLIEMDSLVLIRAFHAYVSSVRSIVLAWLLLGLNGGAATAGSSSTRPWDGWTVPSTTPTCTFPWRSSYSRISLSVSYSCLLSRATPLLAIKTSSHSSGMRRLNRDIPGNFSVTPSVLGHFRPALFTQ